ncbi:MAG: threonine ammonia-lyase [Proteobacteria bacterium]|nr:threonine ammonia-lyase [Pseudomonadota bacterium]
MAISLEDIQAAAERIESAIIHTHLEHSTTLSAMLGSEVFLKFENLQFTSSFKERGALNKLLQLSEAEKQTGVIAMSAGNHAKAVAYHAQRLGIPATIVMPVNTPNVKVEDTENFAAKVILSGTTLHESADHARQLAMEGNLVFVHPYNDEVVITGQGTVALELLAANPDLDIIVVPVGGGGLISGIATAAKAIKSAIRIIGVEVAAYPGAYNALHEEKLPEKGGATIAEGIAVKQPGELTLEIMRRLVDDIVIVNEETIEEALNLLITIEKTVTEGAGAAALAAVMAHPQLFQGKQTAVILSGANIDSRILASVLMRRLVRQGRIVQYLVKISDSPGTLSDVTEMIGDLGGNILEVSHQRMFGGMAVREADLYLTVETRDAEQSEEILNKLQASDYVAEIMQKEFIQKRNR